jgi:hypothetical protein
MSIVRNAGSDGGTLSGRNCLGEESVRACGRACMHACMRDLIQRYVRACDAPCTLGPKIWDPHHGSSLLQFHVRLYTHLKIVAGGCDGMDAQGETAVASAAPERTHLLAIRPIRNCG